MANNAASYVANQCTWYVAKTLSWVPGGLGNAYQWLSNAQSKGLSTGNSPQPGAIAVWNGNLPGSGGNGHVAVVQSVNPDGSFVVSEANYYKSAATYGSNDVDTRNVQAGGGADFSGFIYPPGGGGASGNVSELSYGTLEQLWTEAGGPSSAAATAAAVAIAESSGNPNNVQQGQPYGSTGWGLWQITPGNSESQFGTDNQLLDPMANAKAAVAKFNAAGGSFSPWTTYTSGVYTKFLNGSNYSGSGGLTSAQQSAENTAGSVFSVSLFGQDVDMDGLVGAATITGGMLLLGIGTLVILATMLEGPLSEAAKMYAPVRAVSAIQSRAVRQRRQGEQMQMSRARLGIATSRESTQSDVAKRRIAVQEQAEQRQAATEARRAQAQAYNQQRTYATAQRRAQIRYRRAGQRAGTTR